MDEDEIFMEKGIVANDSVWLVKEIAEGMNLRAKQSPYLHFSNKNAPHIAFSVFFHCLLYREHIKF